MFSLILQHGTNMTGLSKFPVIAMFLFLAIFILVTVYTFSVDKKDMKKWSEMPINEDEEVNQDN
jgi:cbb3-type cytochrome oxidase subunit 3